MNGVAAVVLDLDAAQSGALAQAQRRDAVAPIGAFTGEVLDHRRAAALAEQDEVAHMCGLRRSRAPDMDDLHRTVEDDAGFQREHETIGEEGGVERGKGLGAAGIAVVNRRFEQLGPLVQCATTVASQAPAGTTLSSDSSGAK